MTRLPSVTGTGDSEMSFGGHVSVSELSTDGSRSVRNAVRVPGRRLSWVICPSTQTVPSRWIHAAIWSETTRTGHGCSGVLLAAGEGPLTSRGV